MTNQIELIDMPNLEENLARIVAQLVREGVAFHVSSQPPMRGGGYLITLTGGF